MQWASDNQLMFLSSFMSWIQRATFYPVKNISDVTVKVCQETSTHLKLPTTCCPECISLLESSDIVDAIAAVNWREINNFNLKSSVSFRFNFVGEGGYVIFEDQRLHVLATSARGAMAFGFTNGQCKMLMIDLVAVVRTVFYDDHNLQLNIYVSILMHVILYL